MPPLKVVVAGPVAAGKSTFIRSLSDTEVVDTDEAATEALGKPKTTVALDFGTVTLDGLSVFLFGTPGQERFDFVWEVLCEGAFGLVLLVPGNRPGAFPTARRVLEFITSRLPLPFVLAVTHQDLDRVWRPDEVADYFDLPGDRVVGVDARERSSAADALAALLRLLDSPEPALVHSEAS